jgi:hypothetical protein
MRERIGGNGKWTSEDGANDEADRHDAFHESQRQLDVKVAAYRQTRP